MNPSGLTSVFSTPKPKRQYDALEVSLQKRFSSNWFASAGYVYSRLYGNYAGLSNSDEISTPTTGRGPHGRRRCGPPAGPPDRRGG